MAKNKTLLLLAAPVLAVALVLGALAVACGGSKSSNSDYTDIVPGVSGTLTGNRVANVNVRLQRNDGIVLNSAVSDAQGRYQITGIADGGSYQIVPVKDGLFFTPSSRAIDYNKTGMSGVDFSAEYLFPEYVSTYKLALAGRPQCLIPSKDGTAVYVGVGAGASQLNIVDTQTDTMVKRILLGGGDPVGLVLSTDGKTLYAALSDGAVAAVDLAKGVLAKRITDLLGPDLVDLAISPDNRFLYTASRSREKTYIILIEEMQVVLTVPVPAPTALAVDPGNKHVYISSYIEGGSGRISLIPSYNQSDIGGTITNLGFEPGKISFSRDGKYFFVLNTESNRVTAYLTETKSKVVPVPDIGVGNEPTQAFVTQDDRYLYVTNGRDNTISIISLPDFRTSKTISLQSSATETGLYPLGVAISLTSADPLHIKGYVANRNPVGDGRYYLNILQPYR